MRGLMNKIKYYFIHKILNLLFLCFLFFNKTYGQEYFEINFDRISSENYKIEKGLSQNSAYSITQDSKDYIWIGTWDGLNRYDGYDFLTFRPTVSGHSNELSNQTIYVLFTDKNETVWIGTDAGLNSYNHKTGNFTQYKHSKKQPFSISGDTILSIAEQDENTLWIGTNNGLNRFDKTTGFFYHFKLNPNNANSPSNNNINCILIDKNNNIWFGTNEGLNYFDRQKKLFFHWYSGKNPNSLSSDIILDLLIDNNNKLWICSDNGINIMDINTKKITKKYQSTKYDDNSLSNNNVTSILQDNEGVIWLGTYGGGLNRYDKKNDNFISFKNNIYNERSLSNDFINKLFQDKSGIIWVATAWKGVSKIDKYSNRFNHIRHVANDDNSLNNNNVWGIYQDGLGKIWIATDNGINIFDREQNKYSFIQNDPNNPNTIPTNLIRWISQDKSGLFWIGTLSVGLISYDRENKSFTLYSNDQKNPHSISNNNVNYILEDKQNNLWIATDNGLNLYQPSTKTFKRFMHDPDKRNSISNNTVYYIYEDKEGLLWFCTLGGLNSYNPVSGKFNVLKRSPGTKNTLSSDKIFSLYEDNEGTFWIATFGGGLNRFNRKTGEIKYYLEENGLPNNVVYNIFEDKNDNLWITTNYGLSKFNKENENFVNYDVKDGIQSNEFNLNSAFHNKETGEMFFGGMNGLNSFYPNKIIVNTYIPPVVITKFRKFDKLQVREIFDGDTIFLTYNDNFFSFEFAAMDYSNPSKNKYAYKLENFDNNWNYCDAYRRFAGYTKVPAGTYVFRVKASNSDGIWNEKGISFTIIISPPWWRTWWFRIGSALLISLIVWYIIFLRLRNIRIRHEDEKKILAIEKQMFQLEQTALRLQMNPHFIFNTLNSIQSFVIANNTDKAINYLAKFSTLMRFILAHSQKSFVNLSDEIKAMDIYLDVERLRFDYKFDYTFDIALEIDEEFIEIPPMIIQPYIENAIIHGILHKEDSGHIKISMNVKDEKFLICVIEDNGVGRARAEQMKAKSDLKHKSRGMLITQKRLEILNKSGNDQTNVKITDLKDENNTPSGTRVEILIPYKESE